MKEKVRAKKKILELLEVKVYGLSIIEIADSVGISRVTASKYLAVLEAEGKVFVREIGNTKLHYKPGKHLEMEMGVKKR